MTKKKKVILGRLLVVIGIAAVCFGAFIIGFNACENAQAAKASTHVLGELEDVILDKAGGSSSAIKSESTDEAYITIDGKRYIGIIEVPELDLKLPVIGEWDYSNLGTAPCRYSGSIKTGDLVICAHNYWSMFGPLRYAGVGMEVYFTSADGTVYRYVVENRETLEPREVSRALENYKNSSRENAKWDMTLFTCNLGGATRCVVRCLADGEVTE